MSLTAITSTSRKARSSYLALYSVRRRISTSSSRSSQFHRSDFTGQPFTGSYETGLPTSGPLGSAPSFGAPRLTPKMLKQHLDQFVVGQDRAKKVLSVAVYNHYQRVQELQRRAEEHEAFLARQARREAVEGHPLECQQRTISLPPCEYSDDLSPPGTDSLVDTTPLMLEKSNILLLGPSGVGKTLMAKTLARVLSVPFSMSDCTPFTQAGYIGEDADVCVHRLLAAANYDVAQAEHGIICLDEVDKIATAKVSHGKDVSGEGVQQALLKIIEGTTVQVQAKPEKNAPRHGGSPTNFPGTSLGGSSFSSSTQGPSGKAEVYNVRTDNILFIFSGAFGFRRSLWIVYHAGQWDLASLFVLPRILSARITGPSHTTQPIPIRPGSEEEALYKKHLPFFTPSQTPSVAGTEEEPQYFNPLDLLTPPDLQSYGFIPELVGRIPITTALSPLSQNLLLRILTEPRNSLVNQYTTLFALSGIELRFTTAALHKIAANAFAVSTGARALRTEMETILGDAMFEAPGSSVKFVLVTEAVAARKEKAVYLARGQGGKFHAMIAAEESAWEEKAKKEKLERERKDQANSFEEWRRSSAVGGFS
ncbi:LOW QUALITY PROTEIN: ATP-dependent Clp protease ATP-binding subunit clpX [Coccidioides immitis H538.4]|uniref:ATP-dependent Clp protease ATP-binding subunit clpX n=1 Tax=Coccidioides immitis H538.4 TaxID=396776 RepID=A0A0J8UCI1_COCIT|nr:LOW QUALITY PROTEIN: ATP-dependent Clp protease ATP-binding subunit clpX [Coccidioides immitis H538.4]